MLKKEARAAFRKKREELSYQQKLKWDDLILIQFQKLSLPPLSFALSYYPMEEKNEINSFILTDYLQFRNPGIQIAYPKTNFSDISMNAFVVESEDDFEENDFGIQEPVSGEELNPQQIDLVLIPLFAFDVKGNRVGYGKGFYDRFLKECREDCIKVGVSYFEPVSSIDDITELDVPLNYCITPEKNYVF